MNDKELWLMIRRALLMICKAIEKKYPPNQMTLDVDPSVSVSYNLDE
jgi:hypothetical protein